jgi:hypothetical protein
MRHFYGYNDAGFLTQYVRVGKGGCPIADNYIETPDELPEGDKVIKDGRIYFYSLNEQEEVVIGEEICSL